MVAGIDGLFYKSYCAKFDSFEAAQESKGNFCLEIELQVAYDDWYVDIGGGDERLARYFSGFRNEILNLIESLPRYERKQFRS